MRPSKARQPFSTPGHEPKTGPELGADEWIADHPNSYEAVQITSQRKAIGKRHARRKMRRATRKAQRR